MLSNDILEIIRYYNKPMNLKDIGDLLIGKYNTADIVTEVWTLLDDDILELTPNKQLVIKVA